MSGTIFQFVLGIALGILITLTIVNHYPKSQQMHDSAQFYSQSLKNISANNVGPRDHIDGTSTFTGKIETALPGNLINVLAIAAPSVANKSEVDNLKAAHGWIAGTVTSIIMATCNNCLLNHTKHTLKFALRFALIPQ
jgi:hypothetical protein